MNQKYKSIIAVIVAIWIFAMGFVIGNDNGDKKAREELANQQSASTNTTPQIAEKPNKPSFDSNGGTTDNGNNGGATNNGGTTDNGNNAGTTDNGNSQPAPTDPTQYTDDQIIEMMNYYVNLVKAETNMTASKSEKVTVVVTDCSVPSLIDTVNGIVDRIVGNGGDSYSYTISNGVVASTADPEATVGSDTPFSLIPPTNKQFSVTKEGVADASVTVEANGNITYTVKLVPESTTLTSPTPVYNSTAIGYLDLAGLDISPAEISQADMQYPGSTISVTVDANDKVVKLYNGLPMSGDGKASIFFASGSATFEGALDETWEFTY
ncbi:MAG: hypothetical protein IKJ27_01455 [Clostridia bacterium]|nr:hypothetical protein [Clostridia bacterium]